MIKREDNSFGDKKQFSPVINQQRSSDIKQLEAAFAKIEEQAANYKEAGLTQVSCWLM